MPRNRIVVTALLLGGLVASSACVTGFAVEVPPPGVRIEVRGFAPSPAHVWIDGHWAWEGRWVWVAGRWVVPPAGRRSWVPGRWERHHRGWVWVEGRWRR